VPLNEGLPEAVIELSVAKLAGDQGQQLRMKL